MGNAFTFMTSLPSALSILCGLLAAAVLSDVPAGGSTVARQAAIAYSVISTHGAGTDAETEQFSVIAAANRLRADLTGAQPGAVVVLDRLLWQRGARPIALNTQNETWFELQHTAPFAPRSRYLTPLPGGTARDIKWHLTDLGVTATGERQYAGRLSYDVHGSTGGEKVVVSCDATLHIATTDRVDRGRWMGAVFPVSAYAAVAEKLATAEASVTGFPVQIVLTVSRKYAAGPAMTESVTVEVRDIMETAADDLFFQRPPHYKLQRPIYGVPGQ